jgi:hypothetical protein
MTMESYAVIVSMEFHLMAETPQEAVKRAFEALDTGLKNDPDCMPHNVTAQTAVE